MCEYIKERLTANLVERLKSDTDVYISDIEIPGFHLRYAAKTGRKVFYLRYTLHFYERRIDRNLKLGNFPEISCTNARIDAIKYRGQILAKIDPWIERQENLRKTIMEEDKKIPLKIVMEEYLNTHSKVMKKPQTSAAEFIHARKRIIPMMGHIPINELNIRHLEKMMEEIGARNPATANLTLMLMSYFLNWCEKQEYRTLNSNPVGRVRKFKLKGRDRVMSQEEYVRFFDALKLGRNLNILNPVGFDILEFIAFTGCRSSEPKGLTWGEVDFDNHLLRLKDSKTGAKSVPVGDVAMDIIRAALPNKKGNDSPVFPNSRGGHFQNLYTHWEFVCEQAKLEDMRIHDLRHSFATMGSSTGENAFVLQTILGHSAIATTNRYTHINPTKAVEGTNKISEMIAGLRHTNQPTTN